jgi:hypothetical protein
MTRRAGIIVFPMVLAAQNRDPKLETLVASIVDRVRPELILFRIGNSIDWIGNSILDSKFNRRRPQRYG